jgi:hypothetical protein
MHALCMLQLRLVDQRTGATTWTHGVHGESSRGFWKLFSGVSQLFSPMHTKFGGGVSTSREVSWYALSRLTRVATSATQGMQRKACSCHACLSGTAYLVRVEQALAA